MKLKAIEILKKGDKYLVRYKTGSLWKNILQNRYSYFYRRYWMVKESAEIYYNNVIEFYKNEELVNNEVISVKREYFF